MLLSDQFLCFNFMGVRQYPNMLYELHLVKVLSRGSPHFMNFSSIEEGDSVGADHDDSFA
jgi:pre-mRNA-processing factor 8